MLNEGYRERAVQDLKKADAQYTSVLKKTISDMERLQNTRTIAVRTIQHMERYVVSLANRPRNYETKLGEIKLRYVKFQDAVKRIQEAERSRQGCSMSGMPGAAGVLGGVGIAAFGPSAAMAAAMAFGTASTGTAITSLSGAAATNAALAWLGGGTLAAGGIGVAGGQAVLNLMGPVGWVIGGASLIGSMAALNLSNVEIAEKAEKSIVAMKREMERMKEVDVQVVTWNKETKALSNQLSQQINHLKTNRKKDYNDFTKDESNELVSLMNAAEVLAKKIGQTISGRKR